MLELVDHVRRQAAPVDELRVHELREGVLQRRIGDTRDRRQQLAGEGPAERRGHLRDFLYRRQAVQARHQRLVQRRRDRERRERPGEGVLVALVLEYARLQRRLRQLLDEERHAIGSRDGPLEDFIRQRLAAGYRLDQGGAFAAGQASECDAGDVRTIAPGRLELWPKRTHEEHSGRRYPLDQVFQQLEGRCVAPMQVLDRHQHRILRGHRLHDAHARVHRSLLDVLGGRAERRIAVEGRQGQERRQERRERRLREPELTQRCVELVELVVNAVGFLQAQRPLPLVDLRVERGVPVIRRAVVQDAVAELVVHMLPETLQDAGLAETRFARDQDDLAFARLRLLPASQQEIDLLLAPYQRNQSVAARLRVEAAVRPGRLAYEIGFDRLRHALERLRPEVVPDEETLD